MNDPLIGQELGTYRIERVLGRGGMATVYYAWDIRLNRPVAVKVIDARFREDRDYALRFLQEAEAAASLRHPSIVHVYYADEQDSVYFFAMEYIEGPDLGAVLRQQAEAGTYLPRREVLRIVQAIGEALDYIHDKGLVHRDVKPSNIMIARDGRVVLTDFGLVLDVAAGSIGAVLGSPRYIAPEQAVSSAHAVPQSDLYSLGAILYEMIAGQPPFDAQGPLELAMQHINAEPRPLRASRLEIPPAVEEVVLKALAKGVTSRYTSGAALVAALAAAWPAEEIPAPLPPVPAAVADKADTQARVRAQMEAEKAASAARPSRTGPIARLLARGAAFTQDQLAGTTFALFCLALLGWLGLAGHAPAIPWPGLWFVPTGLLVVGTWLLYRRWWLLVGGLALTGVASSVAGLGWGRWVALGAMVACGGLLAVGLFYLARKGGALAGLRARVAAFDWRRYRPSLPHRADAPPAEEPGPPAQRERWSPLRRLRERFQRAPVPPAEKQLAPAAAPALAGSGGGPFWAAVADWWPTVVQQGVTLAWLQLRSAGKAVVAHLGGDQVLLEKIYRAGKKVWGESVEDAEAQAGFLALTCRPQGQGDAATIPDDLRTLVPVGAGRAEELWVCLAGRGHVVYVAEDATAPAAALRAAAVALLVQMGERVKLGVCDPVFHLAGLRRAVSFHTTSQAAYNDWLTGDLYDAMMGRLGRVERGETLEGEPWWVLLVGDSTGLETALDLVLSRGRETRICLLALASPQTEAGRRLIRRAKTIVCYPLRSEQTSWDVMGHAGAAELRTGQVLVTMESPGGAVRLPAEGVFVDDVVVAQVLRLRAPAAAEEAQMPAAPVPLPTAAPAAGPAVAARAPSPSAAPPMAPVALNIPADVRAVLEVVFREGVFGVRRVYEALAGQVPKDRVTEIGKELETAGIVGESRGPKGRKLVEGLTWERIEALWQAQFAVPVESVPVPPSPAPAGSARPLPPPAARPAEPADELAGLPVNVQAVLRHVLDVGRFEAAEAYTFIRIGGVTLGRVVEIGRQLEAADIIRPAEEEGQAAMLADGMTAEEAANLWRFFYPASGEAATSPPAVAPAPAPAAPAPAAPAPAAPAPAAEVPSWLANLLRG